MASKITIGQQVKSSKLGFGAITKVITKSTGYVEVTYNSGLVKKEMAFNLTDENGDLLKSKPAKKELTEEQRLKNDREHARFMTNLNMSVLKDNFFTSQIKSGTYNTDLIR